MGGPTDEEEARGEGQRRYDDDDAEGGTHGDAVVALGEGRRQGPYAHRHEQKRQDPGREDNEIRQLGGGALGALGTRDARIWQSHTDGDKPNKKGKTMNKKKTMNAAQLVC